jgi:hypothetical protein
VSDEPLLQRRISVAGCFSSASPANTTAVPSRATSASPNSSAVSDPLRWSHSAQAQRRTIDSLSQLALNFAHESHLTINLAELLSVRVNCLTWRLLSFVPDRTVAYLQTFRPLLLLVLLTR